ncbi:MAG: hypothetical protein E6K53_07960 [Gammaproteobacteria bacterium]|nr:MAG: hypothetical protein E6K53_07960 [Gammaproteobacteria bacterium]
MSLAQTSDALFEVGRLLFVLGLAALGMQIPLVGDFVPGLEPVPTWLPLQLPLAYLSWGILLGTSMMIASGSHMRFAAIVLALMFFAWFALLQLPRLIAHADDGVAWACTFAVLALFAAAWLLAARGKTVPRVRLKLIDTGAVFGPRLFGACVAAFGILQFVYRSDVASLFPALPYFAYFSGGVCALAGVALVAGVRERLVAIVLGAVFGSWVLIVCIPRVAAAPGDRTAWTGLLLALALCGTAWLVAGSFSRKTPRPSPARADQIIQDALYEAAA